MSNIDDELEDGLDENLDDINYEEFLSFLDGSNESKATDVPDVDISSIFKKIREKEEKLAELNNPTTEYNEDTERCFEQFASDLLTLYPTLEKKLSKRDIINRLKANITKNIKYASDLGTKKVGDVVLRVNGDFSHSEGLVRIRKDNSDIEKSTLTFHEFVHALVEDNPFEELVPNDNYIVFSNDEDRMFLQDFESLSCNFIVEAMTTLIQEDYERKILGIERKRVNGYLPVYARQLRAIIGDELIEDFLVHFKYVKPALKYFYSGDKKISMKSLAYDNDLIEKHIRIKNSDIVAIKNSNIEITLTLILEKFLSENKNLPDRDKLERINAFLKEQVTTDFDYIKRIIEENINDKSLIDEYPLVCYAYRVNSKNYFDLIKQIKDSNISIDPHNGIALSKSLKDLKNKYEEFAIKKFFGFTNFSYDPNTHMLKYDSSQIQSYEKYKHLYKALYELYNEKIIDDEDLNISSVKGASTISTDTTRNQLLTGDTQEDHALENLTALLHQITGNLADGLRLPEFLSGHALLDDKGLNHYMRLSAKNDYYVIADNFKNVEARFPVSIEEAIKYYIECSEEIPEYKEGYLLAIKELEKLNSEGVTTVFVNGYGFIYENDLKGENVIILFEDGEDPAELKRESFELKDIDMVFSKRDVKEL